MFCRNPLIFPLRSSFGNGLSKLEISVTFSKKPNSFQQKKIEGNLGGGELKKLNSNLLQKKKNQKRHLCENPQSLQINSFLLKSYKKKKAKGKSKSKNKNKSKSKRQKAKAKENIKSFFFLFLINNTSS